MRSWTWRGVRTGQTSPCGAQRRGLGLGGGARAEGGCRRWPRPRWSGVGRWWRPGALCRPVHLRRSLRLRKGQHSRSSLCCWHAWLGYTVMLFLTLGESLCSAPDVCVCLGSLPPLHLPQPEQVMIQGTEEDLGAGGGGGFGGLIEIRASFVGFLLRNWTRNLMIKWKLLLSSLKASSLYLALHSGSQSACHCLFHKQPIGSLVLEVRTLRANEVSDFFFLNHVLGS